MTKKEKRTLQYCEGLGCKQLQLCYPEELRVDCDYWYPEKEECMKMTAALVEFGAINYHATMKGQPRSCCGNKIGCYLTEARTIVRQQKSREYKICAYDDIKGTLCGDNSLSTKFNHAVTCEDCLKILKEKAQ